MRTAACIGSSRSTFRDRRIISSLAIIVVLGPALAGCLGIERTEWAFQAIQATNLADAGLDGEGVTVAVIDTGIDATHPALDHIDIVAWRDYLGNQAEPYDDSGHGTHVAGIIAASGGSDDFFSGASIRGVAPKVSLIVAKVCSIDECDGDAVELAINWAASRGADIITLSLGGRPALIQLGPSAESAVDAAAKKGAYVVVAAGNEGTDHGDVESPSSARLAIAVGAVDESLRVAPFSSRGGQNANQGTTVIGGQGVGGRADPHKKPELVAPGVEILSAWKDGQYARASGTSQAAPFVAGTLALLLQKEPEWQRTGAKNTGEPAVVAMKEVLHESAKAIAGQRTPHDNAAGYGLIQGLGASERLAIKNP